MTEEFKKSIDEIKQEVKEINLKLSQYIVKMIEQFEYDEDFIDDSEGIDDEIVEKEGNDKKNYYNNYIGYNKENSFKENKFYPKERTYKKANYGSFKKN